MKQCCLLTCKNGGSRSAHKVNILVKLNIVKLTNSVSMRRCWQGVHRCMVGSRVVVPVLIIHVGIVIVRLVRWWWCARCQYTETRYIYITRYMLE